MLDNGMENQIQGGIALGLFWLYCPRLRGQFFYAYPLTSWQMYVMVFIKEVNIYAQYKYYEFQKKYL